ncbi:MAG: hypothetical protein ACXWKH_04140 [Limisphaerales bacterium]
MKKRGLKTMETEPKITISTVETEAAPANPRELLNELHPDHIVWSPNSTKVETFPSTKFLQLATNCRKLPEVARSRNIPIKFFSRQTRSSVATGTNRHQPAPK